MKFRPYLHIVGGKCEEALGFYKKIFGGKNTEPMRWKDGPDMGLPKEMGDQIMHVEFESPAVSFMAGDSRPGVKLGEDQAISLSISTPDVDEATRVFNALAEGAKVEMPFEKAFWGAMFGMLTDKYGIEWMINSQPES